MRKLIFLFTVFMGSSAYADQCTELQDRLNQCDSDLSYAREVNSQKRAEYSELVELISNPQESRRQLRQCRRGVLDIIDDIEYLEADYLVLRERADVVTERNRKVSREYNRKSDRLFLQWECLVVDKVHAGNGVGYGRTESAAIQNAKANVHKDNIAKLTAKLKKAKTPAESQKLRADIARYEGYAKEVRKMMRKKGARSMCFKISKNQAVPLTEAMIVAGP